MSGRAGTTAAAKATTRGTQAAAKAVAAETTEVAAGHGNVSESSGSAPAPVGAAEVSGASGAASVSDAVEVQVGGNEENGNGNGSEATGPVGVPTLPWAQAMETLRAEMAAEQARTVAALQRQFQDEMMRQMDAMRVSLTQAMVEAAAQRTVRASNVGGVSNAPAVSLPLETVAAAEASMQRAEPRAMDPAASAAASTTTASVTVSVGSATTTAAAAAPSNASDSVPHGGAGAADEAVVCAPVQTLTYFHSLIKDVSLSAARVDGRCPDWPNFKSKVAAALVTTRIERAPAAVLYPTLTGTARRHVDGKGPTYLQTTTLAQLMADLTALCKPDEGWVFTQLERLQWKAEESVDEFFERANELIAEAMALPAPPSEARILRYLHDATEARVGPVGFVVPSRAALVEMLRAWELSQHKKAARASLVAAAVVTPAGGAHGGARSAASQPPRAPRSMQCWHCGSESHLKRKCPTYECLKCRAKGHVEKDCPSKNS